MKIMKTLLVILCLVLCVGSLTQASYIQPHEVHAHISNFALALTSQLPIIGTDADVCYADFEAKVTEATTFARNEAQICIDSANNETQQDLDDAKATILTISNELTNITNELNTCKNYPLGEMISCVQEWSVKLDEVTAKLNQTIMELQQNLTDAQSNINATEISCIDTAIDLSKNNTEQAYEVLESCLIYGTTTTSTTMATTTTSTTMATTTTESDNTKTTLTTDPTNNSETSTTGTDSTHSTDTSTHSTSDSPNHSTDTSTHSTSDSTHSPTDSPTPSKDD